MAQDAAIFPGQGAQSIGMGRDVADAYGVARDTFAEADSVLGFGLSDLCFNGPDERLSATDVQQPAILTTSVALFRAAVDAGMFKPDDFAAVGGLSLGEYTALHIAGVLSFADALKLVYKRGQLMQAACDATDGGMVSLMGADESKVDDLCAAVGSAGRVSPANFNCPGQIVISGQRAACEAAARQAEDFGMKAVPLKVAGAFHSALMKPAADELRETLATSEFQPPRIRVVSNVDANYHDDPATLRDSLYQQVFSPVRWQMCVERMIADGCARFFEVGPGKVLVGLLRKINRDVKGVNVSTADKITTNL
jgi:[acyl-carrier-protein] S-malonyltransferase